MTLSIEWLDRPEDHDYLAAESYLSLTYPQDVVADLVPMLRAASVQKFKAKDIVRASHLKPLDERNRHVAKDLQKIKDGTKLSPVLLVRNHPMVCIADGWHRICAVYLFDEDAWIHGKLV